MTHIHTYIYIYIIEYYEKIILPHLYVLWRLEKDIVKHKFQLFLDLNTNLGQ